jgi:hypothetical protein
MEDSFASCCCVGMNNSHNMELQLKRKPNQFLSKESTHFVLPTVDD